MTRLIPAPANISYPNTRSARPNHVIYAGSAANTGQWRDIAGIHNLALATMHAQPVFNHQFDGTFIFNVGGFTDIFETTVPELSSQHLSVVCRLYGFSPAGAAGGQVRFTSLATGNTAIITLNAAPAVWYAGAAVLDMTVAFPVLAYDTITVAVDGQVDVDVIQMEYQEVLPLGLYPGADDELAAGVPFDNSWPLDTSEVGADRSVRSEFGETLFNTITDLSARVRVYSSFVYPATSTLGVLDRPYRTIVPVQANGTGGHVLTWRMQVTPNAVIPRSHYIQYSGNPSFLDGQTLKEGGGASRGFRIVPVAAAAAVTRWETGTIRLESARGLVQEPGAFVGFAWVTVYPDFGLTSFTVWGT